MTIGDILQNVSEEIKESKVWALFLGILIGAGLASLAINYLIVTPKNDDIVKRDDTIVSQSETIIAKDSAVSQVRDELAQANGTIERLRADLLESQQNLLQAQLDEQRTNSSLQELKNLRDECRADLEAKRDERDASPPSLTLSAGNRRVVSGSEAYARLNKEVEELRNQCNERERDLANAYSNN